MKAKGTLRLRGIAVALLLAIVGAMLAWACVRPATVRALPATTPLLQTIAPHHPEVILSNATVALVKQRGIVTSAMLADVRHAAQEAPLDARAYVVLGHQQLLDDQPLRAVRTLEAGQRLDPRNPLIHLLLLDRYLRTSRYADAAAAHAAGAKAALVGTGHAGDDAAKYDLTLDHVASDPVAAIDFVLETMAE